ncbi:hypothetical protein BC940DRAFT_308075 [Gongronella butleri]|nr:hypothetical protein BC940DRAFT_308075 [Gongronella butleri]
MPLSLVLHPNTLVKRRNKAIVSASTSANSAILPAIALTTRNSTKRPILVRPSDPTNASFAKEGLSASTT